MNADVYISVIVVVGLLVLAGVITAVGWLMFRRVHPKQKEK